MRNISAEEKMWRASSLSLVGFTMFFSCALGSIAAARAQTSFSRLVGEGEEKSDGSLLHQESSEGTLPGAMTLNPGGTFLDDGVFAGQGFGSFVSSDPPSIFLESATRGESGLNGEITPVSEPRTWVAAVLVGGFLIWQRRKGLTKYAARFRMAPIPGLISSLRKLCETPVKENFCIPK
jgi:hypothetical protein